MAKLDAGDRIVITDGEFKGSEGVILGGGGMLRGRYDVSLTAGKPINVDEDHAAPLKGGD